MVGSVFIDQRLENEFETACLDFREIVTFRLSQELLIDIVREFEFERLYVFEEALVLLVEDSVFVEIAESRLDHVGVDLREDILDSVFKRRVV